jgi:hypothetical protein
MTKNGLIKHFFFLSLYTLTIVAPTLAQNTQRIELAPPGSSDTYQVVPMGEKGVLLISKPTKNSYNVQKFDTNLAKVFSIDGSIETNLDYVTSTYDGQSVFLLFSRYRSTVYQIVKVNIGPGFVETFTINTLDRFEITEFKTLGYSLFMAGTVRDEPVLIHANLVTSQTKVLPSAIKGSNAIQSIEVDTVHRFANVSFAVKKGKQTRIIARSYDEVGKVQHNVSVDPSEDYSLLNGRLQVLNDSVKLMIGTYGYRTMQSSTAAASQGLFISKLLFDEVQFTQYHSFTDFKNFFNFLSDRQQEKMDRRIQRKKEDGSDLKLNYRLLVHDIIPKDNQYVLVAEVFYPEYRPNPGMGFGSYYGNPWMYGTPFGSRIYNPWLWNPLYGSRGLSNQQVFDGFIYTHAIVAGLSKDGKLIWDNSINFDNVKSMTLSEKINVQVKQDGLTRLVYTKDATVRSKIIKGETVIDSDRNIPVDSGQKGDKIRKTDSDAISHWFDNYYLAWGDQKIINTSSSTPENRGKRSIFFLNKITFN